MEITYLAADIFYLAIGHDLDVGVLTAIHHHRGFDTLRAIQSGEGF